MNGAGFVHAPTTKSGGLMLRCHNHAGFTAGALLAASIAVAATASSAMPRYDGLWSVSIVTTKGDCIASYRYPMRIVGGVLANGADIAQRQGRGRWRRHRRRQPRRHPRLGLRPARRQCRQWLMEDELVRRFMDRRAALVRFPSSAPIVMAGHSRSKNSVGSLAYARPSTS